MKKTNVVLLRAGSSPRAATGTAPQWPGADRMSPPFCVEQQNSCFCYVEVGKVPQPINKYHRVVPELACTCFCVTVRMVRQVSIKQVAVSNVGFVNLSFTV